MYDLDELAETADDHWLILTGCRKGLVRSALQQRAVGSAPPRLWTG